MLESVGSLGTEIESASGDIDWAPTRMSPNRGSCWDGPDGAEGLAAIAHQADVDVRLDGPGLEGLEDLPLPGGGRLLGVERLEQRAGLAGDRRSVGGEAQRQPAGVGPGDAEVAGTARSSSTSTQPGRRLRLLWLSMAHTSRLTRIRGNSHPSRPRRRTSASAASTVKSRECARSARKRRNRRGRPAVRPGRIDAKSSPG